MSILLKHNVWVSHWNVMSDYLTETQSMSISMKYNVWVSPWNIVSGYLNET
jgi:hypothetical protein